MGAFKKRSERYKLTIARGKLNKEELKELQTGEMKFKLLPLVIIVILLLFAIIAPFVGIDDTTRKLNFRIENVGVIRVTFSGICILGVIIVGVLSGCYVYLKGGDNKTEENSESNSDPDNLRTK